MAGINEIGVTFAPTTANADLARRRAPSEVQQAIEILSLKLPEVLGARGIAPQALLQAPGAGGIGGGEDVASAVVTSVLRSVLGGGGAIPGAQRAVGQAPASRDTTAIGQTAQALSRATPRIIPGIDPILHVAQQMSRGAIPSRAGTPFGFETGALQTFGGRPGESLFDTIRSLGSTGEDRQRVLTDFFRQLQGFEDRLGPDYGVPAVR